MITFRDLNNWGRFGNQLFYIASTIGIAERQGYNFGFPEWKYQQWFEFPLPIMESTMGNYSEPFFKYDEVVCADNTNLSGYFQSDKYFNHCDDLVEYYFQFKKEVVEKIKNKYEHILDGNTCAVHVRRGDYVNNKNHPVLDINYYRKAFNKMGNCRFLVFSDDIDWCKQTMGNLLFIERGNEVEDFILMSLCKNFIIANSSYSWWAAWLSKNKDKKIIAPYKWFGSGLAHHSTVDLIPDEWIRV